MTTTTSTATPALTDQQLSELLELIKGAESVELKPTVPVSQTEGH